MSEMQLRELITHLQVDVRCLIESHSAMRKEMVVQTDTIQRLLSRVHHLENRK